MNKFQLNNKYFILNILQINTFLHKALIVYLVAEVAKYIFGWSLTCNVISASFLTVDSSQEMDKGRPVDA